MLSLVRFMRPIMRMLTAVVAISCSVVVLTGCSASRRAEIAQPVRPAVTLTDYRCIWVAGFRTGVHRELDVNAAAVHKFRAQLRTKTNLHIVDEPPLSIRSEDEVARTERFKAIALRHGTPLVLTGTISFDHGVASRRTRGYLIPPDAAARLRVQLVWIDGSTGRVVGTESLPAQNWRPGFNRKPMAWVFDTLFSRINPMFLQAVTGTSTSASAESLDVGAR